MKLKRINGAWLAIKHVNYGFGVEAEMFLSLAEAVHFLSAITILVTHE